MDGRDMAVSKKVKIMAIIAKVYCMNEFIGYSPFVSNRYLKYKRAATIACVNPHCVLLLMYSCTLSVSYGIAEHDGHCVP